MSPFGANYIEAAVTSALLYKTLRSLVENSRGHVADSVWDELGSVHRLIIELDIGRKTAREVLDCIAPLVEEYRNQEASLLSWMEALPIQAVEKMLDEWPWLEAAPGKRDIEHFGRGVSIVLRLIAAELMPLTCTKMNMLLQEYQRRAEDE